MTDPAPRPLPHPGPPPTPAAVIDAHQRRFDAAENLIRVTDHARELDHVGRLTNTDRVAVAAAEQAWDQANAAVPATRTELDRIVTDTAGGNGGAW